MTKRMLVDATHEEETRVAVIDGNKLEEYDYESSARKPLKGNIFLAKVTRVEPSLQAAFVNFGGNRHGFLPFSEIHPDYFRIPIEDREALIAEQEALLAEEEAFDEEEHALDSDGAESSDDGDSEEDHEEDYVEETGGAPAEPLDDDKEEDRSEEVLAEDALERESDLDDDVPEEDGSSEAESSDEPQEEQEEQEDSADVGSDEQGDDEREDGNRRGRRGRRYRNGRGRRSQFRNRRPEVVGGEEVEEDQRFRFNLRRKYKIQEVIKRGQIMLVQVNKEERGNKGAAVGTYLSLPGRYCVLMPNSPRGGGVSRKIANYKDRARMREIVKELEVPKGMSVIVRTAGVTRTKTEIKRDLDYLMRLWDSIRDLTLQSSAPAMVYEEADLIKRSVRDLYTRDVEEILVAGEEGYKTAKSFMKMLIPSHVKKVQLYDDPQLPLFNRYQIESQINEIGLPEVRLKSGGYLVINPTEALVSIDVNSGKATRERHIEETALKTNLEAADEVARQLRLRDLGGLVVIDFIDMEDRRNNGKVERRMKEALSTDRARVQVGRISSFGLMELSRQRLSPSLTEAQYKTCPHCKGLGLIRTADAMSILVLRAIEEEGIRKRAAQIIVHVSNEVALYILNNKRKNLADIEERYELEVLLRVDDDIPASDYRLEVSRPNGDGGASPEDTEDEDQGGSSADEEESREGSDGRREGASRRRGRRGGRGRNRNRGEDSGSEHDAQTSDEAEDKGSQDQVEVSSEDEEGGEKKGGRSRGRRSRKPLSSEGDASVSDEVAEAVADDADVVEKPSRGRKSSRAKKSDESANQNELSETADEQKPKSGRKPRKKKEPEIPASEAPAQDAGNVSPLKAVRPENTVAREHETVNQAPKEKKKGWWNRLVE